MFSPSNSMGSLSFSRSAIVICLFLTIAGVIGLESFMERSIGLRSMSYSPVGSLLLPEFFASFARSANSFLH